MIHMAVAQQDDFHLRRVQTELLHPARKYLLDLILITRIDQHNPSRGGDRRNGGSRPADDVHVIENLSRLKQPPGPFWARGPFPTKDCSST
jgi:hypothetical protein